MSPPSSRRAQEAHTAQCWSIALHLCHLSAGDPIENMQLEVTLGARHAW